MARYASPAALLWLLRGGSAALSAARQPESASVGDSALDSLGRPWEVEETECPNPSLEVIARDWI